ncbi:MAG: NAD(P)-binding protein [Streptosporangiales bacterium]|nr:NAD(P)-binding protein [Streptosporangiales bacterium]
MTDEQYDAIVVGGGHNGLVAAGYLGRAGLSVLVVEKRRTVGGAVASVRTFPGVDAHLSRYSYLVSLLPDQVVADLGLRIELRSRATASYTPVDRDGRPGGLLVERAEGPATAAAFAELTGSAAEYDSWQRFQQTAGAVAGAIAPTLLRPLPRRADLADAVRSAAGADAWQALFERPIGELVEVTFADDAVRGTVLTDAVIGEHTYAHDPTLRQNRVFLYHVVGNGTGEWRVPVGGMGAVSAELERCAREAGAEIVTGAEVREVATDGAGCTVSWVDAEGAERTATAGHVLANVSASTLARLRGRTGADEEGSQLKVNMVLERLPRLRTDVDPRTAFAGTFHIDQGYGQLEAAYRAADAGQLPDPLPAEVYCHSLTDPSILGADLVAAGWQTLTMFGLHTPARLFRDDNAGMRERALHRALAGINRHLAEPIEHCLATDANGAPCIEAKTPLDLAAELDLPGGHIFHGDLQWPHADDDTDDPWGVATDTDRLLICGSSARRGGAVSGIAGHNAAHALLARLDR